MSTFSQSDAADASLEGFRLTREHPVVMLTWSGFYFFGVLAVAFVMYLGLGNQFIAFLKSTALQNPTPESIAYFGGMLAKSWPAFLLSLFLVLCTISIITAGIFRMKLRPEEKSFAYLRLGADELRQVLAHFLLALVWIGVFLATEITIGLGVQLLSGGRGLAFFQTPMGGLVLFLLTFTPMFCIGVRFSLATPLAFVEKRVSLRAAWHLTRGKFWPMASMVALCVLFYMMILVLFGIIGYVATKIGAESNSIVGIIAVMAGLLVQLLLPILQAVTFYGPFAVAYEHLKEPQA